MNDEGTLVDAIAALRSDGYDHDFSVAADALLQCSECGNVHPAKEALIEATSRFEGESDPDDEAVLFGLRCLHCNVLGILVAAYGPAASAEEADVVIALSHR